MIDSNEGKNFSLNVYHELDIWFINVSIVWSLFNIASFENNIGFYRD